MDKEKLINQIMKECAEDGEPVTREEAEEQIESLGGKTSSSVSKKTTAVIVGENPGSKYDKAKELGIPIWTEEEFKEKLG